MPTPKHVKILLADDHALFREGLRLVLTALDNDAEIVEAGDYVEALRLANDHQGFSIALIDLSMPGMEDFEGLGALCRVLDEVPVVVVSGHEDRRQIRRAMQCGASGFIPKTLNRDVFVNALGLIVAGGFYLPPSLVGHDQPETDGEAETTGANAKPRLTPRQFDVLGLLARGLSNKEIARELGLAEGTVKLHVTALLKVLKSSNRTQAVVKAASLGLTTEQPDGLSNTA